MIEPVDISEQEIYKKSPKLLNLLLIDRTTNDNIKWATDNYYLSLENSNIRDKYQAHCSIEIDLILNDNKNIIQPRVLKSCSEQEIRTKNKAEVFTPAWVCNEQNNMIDEAWFGRSNVFNERLPNNKWLATTSPIVFPKRKSKNWESYVKALRLEVSCGEAPYLVSRYDTTEGTLIPIEQRIGLLDRKLRVVSENCPDESVWFEWTKKAFQSVYGYEYQGDNVLLARENLLYTFIFYYIAKFGCEPDLTKILEIATIISWNIWQMDSFTLSPPYPAVIQGELFTKNANLNKKFYCRIKDWVTGYTRFFYKLIKEHNNGKKSN